jgi:hypothetical protein
LFGAVKAKMRPAPGNHDYSGTNGSAYFAYFGGAVGSVAVPWYSFDLGAWHVVSLAAAPDPGCPNYWSASSPQRQWLSADLDAHPSQPVLALFHAPRWSGAEHGDNPDLAAIWNVLAAHHVELAINGHDHVYQRFAPQDASGAAAADGVREIMVSTGGAGHNSMSSYTSGHNLQAWNNTNYGVTTLTLASSSYSWRFTASDGSGWTDSGSSPVNPQHQGGGTVNRAPVANAGPDQTVQAGPSGTASVALDGSASSDPDGDPLSYRWAEGAVTLAATATAAISLPVGVHTITLTVTDPGGLSASDTVLATVQPVPTTASVHVAGLSDSSQILRRKQWQPAVTVAVATEAGQPLGYVVATVRTSGLSSRTLSCTTGTDGSCRVGTPTVNRHGSVTFTVTNLSAASRSYRPADNVVTSLTVTH